MRFIQRIPGFLKYAAAIVAALAIHAFALHLDTEAQSEVREHIAQQQA